MILSLFSDTLTNLNPQYLLFLSKLSDFSFSLLSNRLCTQSELRQPMIRTLNEIMIVQGECLLGISLQLASWLDTLKVINYEKYKKGIQANMITHLSS